MKKILYIISNIKNDGPNNVLKSMIEGLDRSKYEISILSLLNKNDERIVKQYKENKINILEFNFKRKFEILIKGPKKLKKINQKLGFEIYHSHGILPDIMLVKSKLKKDKLKFTTIHNNMYEDYIESFGKIEGNFFIMWHQFYLKKMNKCICCSKSVYDSLNGKLNNIEYVRNAIYNEEKKVERYRVQNENHIRQQYKIPDDAIVYIYAGTLEERKNVMEMVENFNEYLQKNEYLLIVGKGKMKDDIEEKIKKNIILCGFQSNIKEYLQAADIYVSFSKSEGFSISILEALESFDYMLISDIPAHRELFEIDSKIYLGELFSKEDFKQKKEKIVTKIKEENSTERNWKVRRFLQEHLNSKKMMVEYSNIYEENIVK